MKILATIVMVMLNIAALVIMTWLDAHEIIYYLYGSISGAAWLMYEIDKAKVLK